MHRWLRSHANGMKYHPLLLLLSWVVECNFHGGCSTAQCLRYEVIQGRDMNHWMVLMCEDKSSSKQKIRKNWLMGCPGHSPCELVEARTCHREWPILWYCLNAWTAYSTLLLGQHESICLFLAGSSMAVDFTVLPTIHRSGFLRLCLVLEEEKCNWANSLNFLWNHIQLSIHDIPLNGLWSPSGSC